MAPTEKYPELQQFVESFGTLMGVKDYTSAIALGERAVEAVFRAGLANRSGAANIMFNLARAYMEAGRNSEAEPLLVKAIKVYRHTVGEEAIETANALRRLGSVHNQLREFH